MMPTEIYTLSLHDALPISRRPHAPRALDACEAAPGSRLLTRAVGHRGEDRAEGDRKSTRLNSSHLGISYAVFCLKKKIKFRTHNATNYPQHNITLIRHRTE